jgi:hypothetical protein
MSQKIWLGGIYLRDEGGYELVLRSLEHYKKRLKNIRKSPEIKDAPMFATIIEQEAIKAFQGADSLILKINEAFLKPELLQTLESELPLMQKAMECYFSDIQKVGSDSFYSELILDKTTALQDLKSIQDSLQKLGAYE